jgi:hypothetical protein
LVCLLTGKVKSPALVRCSASLLAPLPDVLAPCPVRARRREALGAFLRGAGFRDDAVSWLPASAPAGQNLAAAPDDPRLASWWRGPTLVQASVNPNPTPPRP